jgi:hypothetical protein
MPSPNGKRGHFYENWQHGVGVERIKIIGRECPRIGAEFLDKIRQKLGPMLAECCRREISERSVGSRIKLMSYQGGDA